MSGTNRQPRSIQHIPSDAGTEFCSDTFRKWSENKIHFNSEAPKHQEQNGLVERHWVTIAKLANTLLLHARLNRKFFYYAAKYAQYIHDVIPVRDLLDSRYICEFVCRKDTVKCEFIKTFASTMFTVRNFTYHISYVGIIL